MTSQTISVPNPLQPSPSFAERLDHKPEQSQLGLAGILQEEISAFRAYHAAIRNPDSLESKVRDLWIDDLKPTILESRGGGNHIRPVKNLLIISGPVAMEVSDEDEEDKNDPIPICKDVVQAGKSLKAANV